MRRTIGAFAGLTLVALVTCAMIVETWLAWGPVALVLLPFLVWAAAQ